MSHIILIPVHREQYLSKEEPRLLSAANIAVKTDPRILPHLTIIESADALQSIHEAAANRYAQQPNTTHIVERHQTYAAAARQIYLYHLDHLHTLLS
jgi:hypothetical protein